MSTQRPVALRGVGGIGPWGTTAAAFQCWWQEGRPSRIGPLRTLRERWLPTSVAGEVPPWKPQSVLPDRKAIKLMSSPVQLGVAAALAAWSDGPPAPVVPPKRRGAYTGCGLNVDEEWTFREAVSASSQGGAFDLVRFGTVGQGVLNPLWLVRGLSNNVLAMAALYLDLQGPNDNFEAGAAGPLLALAQAAQAVGDGELDVALAGGSDTQIAVEDLLQRHRRGDFDGPTPFVPSHAGAFVRLEPGLPGGWGVLGWAAGSLPDLDRPDSHTVEAAMREVSALAWRRMRGGPHGPCRVAHPASAGAPGALLRGPGLVLTPEDVDLWTPLGDPGAAAGGVLLLAALAARELDGVAGPVEIQARGESGELAVVLLGTLPRAE
jgi:hypothetical protein